MRLKTVDGQLTLGSAYRLFFAGSALSIGTLSGFVTVLLVLAAVITGEITANGVVVRGRSAALASLAPLVFLPLFVVFYAAFVAALFTFGVWLYRLRRPLLVVDEDGGQP